MRCIYKLKHCLCDILLRHSILQLRSIVIFDNFVVLVARFFWFFRITAYYYVTNLIGVCNSWVYLCGAGCPVGSNLLCWGAWCVAVPVTVLRVFLVNVTSFGARLCWGGGECDIPWYTDPAGILYH